MTLKGNYVSYMRLRGYLAVKTLALLIAAALFLCGSWASCLEFCNMFSELYIKTKFKQKLQLSYSKLFCVVYITYPTTHSWTRFCLQFNVSYFVVSKVSVFEIVYSPFPLRHLLLKLAVIVDVSVKLWIWCWAWRVHRRRHHHHHQCYQVSFSLQQQIVTCTCRHDRIWW